MQDRLAKKKLELKEKAARDNALKQLKYLLSGAKIRSGKVIEANFPKSQIIADTWKYESVTLDFRVFEFKSQRDYDKMKFIVSDWIKTQDSNLFLISNENLPLPSEWLGIQKIELLEKSIS